MTTALVLAGSELRLRWRSLAWWSVAIIALVAFNDAFYPSVKDTPSFDELFEQIPEALLPLVGTLDLTSPEGYLLGQLYQFFLPAVLLVFAIGRGAATLAGEEEDGTLDLLLSQPVGRVTLYVVKAGVMALGLVILAVASVVPTLALGPVLELTIPAWPLAAVTIAMTALCLALGVLAQAAAAATGRRFIGIAIASGYAFVGFLVDGLGQTVEWMEGLRPLTPWYWYAATDAIAEGDIAPGTPLLIAVSAVLVAAGALAFRRRSLTA